MCERYGHTQSRYSSARRSRLVLFYLLLALTTLNSTLNAQPSESDSLLRLRGIFEQQTQLLAEQSDQIESLRSSVESSRSELETSRQYYENEIDALQSILTQQQQALEESERSMTSSQTSQRKAAQSWTSYSEEVETQLQEVAQERDQEAARAHRRGIAFIIAAIVAAAEGAILIAQ